MKKLIQSTLMLFCLSIILGSCYKEISAIKIESDRIQKELVLPAFDKIFLDMPAEVRLSQGNEQKITISAQKEILAILKQNVVDNTWHIGLESGSYSFKKVYIYITLPSISEIYNDGSGDILTDVAFTNLENLKISVDGAGDIHFNGTPKHVDLLIDASGDILLKGGTNTIDAVIDGSGSLSAFDFSVQNATIKVTASGDGELQVSNNLDVMINGSGDVFYKGDPTIISEVNSTGNLIDAN